MRAALLTLACTLSLTAAAMAAETAEGTLTVPQGSPVIITLASNPTTGYRWRLDGTPDPSIIAFSASEYIHPQDGRVGAGGTEIWRFNAVGAGKTVVTFAYARAWEEGTAPAARRSFTVVVTPSP